MMPSHPAFLALLAALLFPPLAAASPDTLCAFVEGDLALAPTTTLTLQIGGSSGTCDTTDPAASEYDRFLVAGTLNAGGATLALVLTSGFVPAPGGMFDVLDFGAFAGSFGAVDLSGAPLPDGAAWDLSRLETEGIVQVPPAATAAPAQVPLPAWALALGAMLLTGVATAARRRSPRP